MVGHRINVLIGQMSDDLLNRMIENEYLNYLVLASFNTADFGNRLPFVINNVYIYTKKTDQAFPGGNIKFVVTFFYEYRSLQYIK